jgi:hypothetical protein
MTAEQMASAQMTAEEIETAITRGLLWGGAARALLLRDAAVAGAALLDATGVGVYPVEFLAYCVRSMGLEQAARLPEPLPGAFAAQLAQGWLVAAAQAAAVSGGASPVGGATGPPDAAAHADVTALWLCRVAKLLAVRRTADAQGRQ